MLTGFGGEGPFIESLLAWYEPRIDDAANFALENRVLLLKAASGVGLDISLGGLPFEESIIARSSSFRFPGSVMLRTCSAEDLVVLKAFAARERDWLDVEGVVIRQGGELDWPYIWKQLGPLAELKGEPEILEQLEQRRVRLEE